MATDLPGAGGESDDLDQEQLILGDLLNHVLDKGVVISGTVTLSVADIDLVVLDLRLLLTSVETAMARQVNHALEGMVQGGKKR